MFNKDVDLINRSEMIEFLRHHFRYWAMSSCSYANCIKLTHVGQPKDVDNDVWWEMFSMDDWGFQLELLLDDWAENNPGFAIVTNGRSGGYLVLCQSNANLAVRGIDQDADFEDWNTGELASRVELVRNFDQLCDYVVEEYIYMCRHNKIVDKEIVVHKTVRVLEKV
jgi:hypothetical protein